MPYVTDEFGRRAAMFLGAMIMCGATVLQTASSSVNMFIGARCVLWKLIIVNTEHLFYVRSLLIGFGQTFAASGAPLLVTELAYPTQRAQLTSLYNTLW